MIYNQLILALAVSASFLDGALAQKGNRNGGARRSTSVASSAAAGTATTASVAATSSAAAAAGGNGGGAAAGGNSTATAGDLALNPDNVQTASQSDGQANAAKGQSPSITYDLLPMW